MKQTFNALAVLLFLLLLSSKAIAQDGMEEYFYQSGKIKVVIAVAFIVLLGLIVYLWRLDRRVTRIEQENRGGQS